MNKYIKYAAGFLTAIALFVGGFYAIGKADAYMVLSYNAVTPATYQYYDFFASSTNVTADTVAANATSTSIAGVPYFDSAGRLDSGYFNIPGAKSVTFYFNAFGGSGNTTFFIQVSPDGVNWYPFNSLVQNVATSSYPGISIASQNVTSTASTTIIDSMNLQYANFEGVRCIAVVAAGTASCKASAAF